MTNDLLTAQTVPAYLAAQPFLAPHIDASRIRSVVEIGDGNLNLVYVVKDAAGRGIVLKQALPYVRMVGPQWPLSPERACREAHTLARHGDLAPHLVPRLLAFDPRRYIIAMEDLSDHRVWRTALNEGVCHEGVASRMGQYVATVAFGTSVLSLESQEHTMAAAAAINPELCAISEDLVFSEPYNDIGRNAVLPENAGDAAELAGDAVMVRAMGRARWIFSTSAEALIHGDLHTGSVMVRTSGGSDCTVDSVKAFDCEFSFYGPVAYDLGALWANYTLAAARAVALGDDERGRWCLDQCGRTWDAFESTVREQWSDRRSPQLFTEDFGEELLDRWRRETWLFAAAKMARRIVGLAKVSDIETLPEELRVGAARGVLRVARSAARAEAGAFDPGSFVRMAAATLAASATR
jgi:5-methylthioribose kinase